MGRALKGRPRLKLWVVLLVILSALWLSALWLSAPWLSALWLSALWPAAPAAAQSNTVILSTTTSTQDSGLLDLLVPMFEKKTGMTVKTISVGTGQALTLAARGEADVAL